MIQMTTSSASNALHIMPDDIDDTSGASNAVHIMPDDTDDHIKC